MAIECSAGHWRLTTHCYQSRRRFSNRLLTFTDKIIQLVHHLIHVVRDSKLARFRSSDPFFVCIAAVRKPARTISLFLSHLFSRIHSAPNDCCITHDRCNTHTLIQPHPIYVYSRIRVVRSWTLCARASHYLLQIHRQCSSSQQWCSHYLRLLSSSLSIVSAGLLSLRIWV